MDEGAGLIDYASALRKVLEHAAPMPAEEAPLRDALGRVLAEDVRALHDMPFFDTSAMDGYALCAADAAEGRPTPFTLQLGGAVRAGQDPRNLRVEPGKAVRIYTGAAAPSGTAAVVPQEDVHADGDRVTIQAPVRPGQHMRYRGEEFRAGDVVAPAGTLVTPGVVAALAASGAPRAAVHGRPRIGLLITGEELVAPGLPLPPGSIYESNSFGVEAALAEMGLSLDVRRIPDDAEATRSTLADLLGTCDVVLTSGGVSVGDHDWVRPAANEIGVRTVLWGVAIKPGKPFYFGLLDRAPRPAALFGLPGNPVSAVVTLYALVRPYLLVCQGLDGRLPVTRAHLAGSLRKRPGRMEFVPCRLGDGGADAVVKRGSHMLGTLVSTNALVLFPLEVETLEPGALVDVMPIDWRYRQAAAANERRS